MTRGRFWLFLPVLAVTSVPASGETPIGAVGPHPHGFSLRDSPKARAALGLRTLLATWCDGHALVPFGGEVQKEIERILAEAGVRVKSAHGFGRRDRRTKTSLRVIPFSGSVVLELSPMTRSLGYGTAKNG